MNSQSAFDLKHHNISNLKIQKKNLLEESLTTCSYFLADPLNQVGVHH